MGTDGQKPDEHVPDAIERVLRRFRAMDRADKMQALVQYSRKLEPVPDRYNGVDRASFTVPECQTRVDIFPEVQNGNMHFYADVNVRQSPTVAAVLAIVFSAVNGAPPEVTMSIPSDFVRMLMDGMGLHAREVGLNAMVARLKRAAQAAVPSTAN
ncbi:MAG: SufE family protein [Rhodanobacteraceae bacterium]